MEAKLIKAINEFYDEMEKDESTEIGELACSLVPKLTGRIKHLEAIIKSPNGNKEKVNELMHELQNCINSSYMWREMGDDEELTKTSNRIIEIRQEVLNIVS